MVVTSEQSVLGFIWHDRTIDAGIDDSVEVRNPSTGVTAHRHRQHRPPRVPGMSGRCIPLLCAWPRPRLGAPPGRASVDVVSGVDGLTGASMGSVTFGHSRLCHIGRRHRLLRPIPGK